MQKFTRSLLAAGAVFGLAACGDDVSVTAPTPPPAAVVTGVTVAPAAITIGVGEKVILSAAVAVSSGSGTPNTTVAWSSANAAIASVSATTGEVTGVAIGTTTIRATAGGITGAAAVTVRAATGSNAATVSIASITKGGLGNPVQLNNVQGQIDVTLNVEPNDQRVTKVLVLVDGVEVASQAFTASSAAIEAAAAAVPITLSFNTAAFDSATGATDFKNGPKVISARVEVAAGTQPAATAGIPVVFNNTSGFVFEPKGSAGVQTSPTGLAWTGGDVTIKLLPVIYTADTVVSATILAMGRSGTANAANSYTVTFPNSAFSASSNPRGIAGYQTETNAAVAGGPVEVISVSSVLSTGQAGPTGLLNYLTTIPVAGNPSIPLIGFIRVDNKAPVILPAQVGTVPTWLNATFALSSSSLGYVAQDTANVNGITPVTGVSGITYTFYVGATLPGAANACDFTGLTAVTSGADLAETIVSTAYRVRAAAKDKLGNQSCFDVENGDTFGVDKTAPTIVSITGPADLSASTAAGAFAATVTDNASGFGTNPVKYSISRLNANGSTSCVIGTSVSTCASTVDSTGLNFSATGGSAQEGYYTTTATVIDQAGNSASLLTRTYLLDATAPAFSGAISAPPLITGGATNTFTALITDNIDLNEIFGTVDYPVGQSIVYPAQSFGSFGAPLEQSATAAYSIANFIRCLNDANLFPANAANKASDITLTLSDQADNMATSSAVITPNVAACGDVGNMTLANGTYSAPNTFGPTTVAYGTGFTSVWNGGGTRAATAGTSATLTAIADVPLNTSGNPFTSVNFYYQTASGAWALIGTAPGALAQTQTTRTWTYTFAWTPTAAGFPVAGSPYQVVAIGVDAQGDAVLTATVAVDVTGT